MADTEKPIWIDRITRICAAQLNAIANTIWDALGNATTPTEARENIGAMPTAPAGGFFVAQNESWFPLSTTGDPTVLVPVTAYEPYVGLTDGVSTWLLSHEPIGEMQIELNGVVLRNYVDFTVLGNEVSFTLPLEADESLVARYYHADAGG